MIAKKKLLQKIHEVIEIKNGAIPLLDKHISASLSFSGLDPVMVQNIREKFQAWMILQHKHVEILKEMAGDIQERHEDVF